jgi:hypothetical protein
MKRTKPLWRRPSACAWTATERVLMASTEQAKGLLRKVFPGVVEIDELQS